MRTAGYYSQPIITEESMIGAVEQEYTFKVAKEQTRSKSQRLLKKLFSLA